MTATLLVLAVIAGCAGLVRWVQLGFLVVTVAGTSMAPAYLPGDRVLVRRRRLIRVRAGEVVVLRSPPDRVVHPLMVKRVAAVPGEPVPIELADAPCGPLDTPVPMDRLLVLGDNSRVSFDSREYGYLRAEHLVGVVTRRLATGRPSRKVMS
jgi:signal peptidase I